MTDDTDTIIETISSLDDQRSQLNSVLAVLCMLVIARKVRAVLPLAAEIVLAESDQGSFLVPAGDYLAADGTCLSVPGSHGPDELDELDELDEAVMPFCAYLGDDNQGSWMPFVSGVTPGGSYRLKIDDILAARQTASAGPPLHAGSGGPGAAGRS